MNPAWSLLRQSLRPTAQPRWVLATLLVMAVGVVMLAPYDQALSLWAKENSWDAFVAFQHHTLFEDGIFGGSDFGLVFQILASLVAIVGWISPRLRGATSDVTTASRVFRQQLHRASVFVSLASIYSGLLLVQGLKFATGRARPYYVFSHEPGSYTHWYELGFHSIVDGRYPGSFPSGHVASASAFFALVFLLPFRTTSQKMASAAVALLCFVSWGGMATARVMGRDHWPTDTLAAGLLTVLSYSWFAALFGVRPWMSTHRTADVPLVLPGEISRDSYAAALRLFVLTFVCVAALWITREVLLQSAN